MAVNVLTIIYYISLPSTTIISHIANLCMLESVDFIKNIIVNPKTKVVNKKFQIYFRFTVTLVLLQPVIFGRFY